MSRVGLVPQAKLAALVMTMTVAQGMLHAQSDDPPPAGRPEDFSGLMGTYEIASRASLTKLAVLEPLMLTIKITQISKVSSPFAPRQSDLHVIPPSLKRDFYVEALPDMVRPDGQSWQFAFRLKPKTAAVQRIPALKLTYYDPRYGKYQVAYSRPIPLIVKAPTQAQAPSHEESIRVPEHVYQLATGPSVLQAEEPALGWLPPLLVILPPAACAAWYAVWRRLRPDEARRARMQRSRAARHALRQLQALDPARGTETAVLVADYLRRRLNLVVAEPTPAEAWVALRRARVSPLVAGKICEFFHACDASRFAPAAQRDGQNLAAQAENLIQAVEAEPCLSRHC